MQETYNVWRDRRSKVLDLGPHVVSMEVRPKDLRYNHQTWHRIQTPMLCRILLLYTQETLVLPEMRARRSSWIQGPPVFLYYEGRQLVERGVPHTDTVRLTAGA